MQFFGVDFGFFNGHGFLFCIPSQSKGEDFLRGVPKFFGKFRATVGLKKTIPLGSFGLTKGPAYFTCGPLWCCACRLFVYRDGKYRATLLPGNLRKKTGNGGFTVESSLFLFSKMSIWFLSTERHMSFLYQCFRFPCFCLGKISWAIVIGGARAA